MKLPEGLLNIKGNRAFGFFELQGTDGNDLREYGTVTDGIHSTCLVLTSPGDVISVPFLIEPGVADFADLVVDGILRESASVSGLTRPIKGHFKRVSHQRKLKNNKRGGLKFYKMEVQRRDARKDLPWNGHGHPPAVGTLEIQLFGKEAVADKTMNAASQGNRPGDSLGTAKRAPTYLEYAHWTELSPFIDPSAAPPSFEIEFNDGKYRAKNSVDRVIKSWSGEYKLIASLKFKLCSTADLFALRFRGVPSYHASSQPNMAERHGSGYHSDGSEAPSLKSDNKDLIIKASASDNSSALIEGVAPAATAKLRPVNNAQFTTTNGFHAPQPSTTSGYRQMMGPLPKFERSCESSSSISSGRACPPSWLQPELHYATQTGYNALHRENLKSRPQGEEVGDISNFKHRNKATVLHGLKESPAHKAWLDTLLIRPDNQEEGFKSPSPPYNKISQLQPADKEKNNNPDEPSVEDELLRLLNQDRSYQAQYSQHGNSSQLQTTAEKLNTPHEKWPSHRASEEKATELPRPSSPPRAHNRTPLLPLSQMTKSNPSIEADRQSTQKQFARFPLEQRTDMARDIPQDPQRHLKTIDQSNEPVDAQNLNLASNPNMEASFVSKTAEPLAMETQTISNHISDIPLASATKDLAENPKGYIPARKPSITSADISTSVPADSISDVSCTNKVQTGSASPQNTPIASQGISTPVIASQSLVQHASKPTESLLSTDNNKIEIQVTSSVIPIEPAKMSGQQVATSQPSGSGKDVFIAESKILQTHAPEKRKVDSMSDKVDLPDSSNGSRKTSTSPALRKSQDSEREFKVAQARIATAQRQKVELANALESIMFSEKTKKLNQEAEQIEKDNLEMQARLDALMNMETEI